MVPRFGLTLGYRLTAFYQPSFENCIGRSFRGVSGLHIGLGYRW